jgi:surfeit locus 1 family protein
MFRPLPVLTAVTLLALAILIGLGTWQLERRAEKHALLAQIEAREKSPPAPVEILFVTGDSFSAFRQATALGTFDHTKEAYVYAPRADTGPTRQGFKVLTPFRLASGGVLIVDRGWIPEANKNPAARAQGQIEGEVELEGVLLPSSVARTFTPPPDLRTRTFYNRDTTAISRALGVSLHRTLIFEASTRVEGGPEPMPGKRDIPDNHLSYALTWFSLGLVLLVIYLRYHYVRGRLNFSR